MLLAVCSLADTGMVLTWAVWRPCLFRLSQMQGTQRRDLEWQSGNLSLPRASLVLGMLLFGSAL